MLHDARTLCWLITCGLAALGCFPNATVQHEEDYNQRLMEHEEPLEGDTGGDEPLGVPTVEQPAQSDQPPIEPTPTEPAAPAVAARPAPCPAQQLVPPAISGGCHVRLVTPAQCEVVDLRGGRTYEMAWTTDGTRCETPWTLQVAGEPLSAQNLRSAKLSINTEAGITSYGGILRISAADLEGLTSTSGLYHWSVASFYGSHPGAHTFQVLR
jgi:hypothetical protein